MSEQTTSGGGSNSTMDDAKEKVSGVAVQAQEKMGGVTNQAREQARKQVDQRSTEVGERVSSSASDFRSVAEQLRVQNKTGPAKMVEQVADRSERVGSYLSESDADRILSDVENFGRRQPWAVVAGGVMIGFAASRLLKASSTSRYRASTADYPRIETRRAFEPQPVDDMPTSPTAGMGLR